LGNISEDILKDSRKSFENGLPTTAISSANANLVDTTIWGRVPTVQALVNAFDNTPSTRVFQDVGLDGINDVDEKYFHPNFSSYADPSADDYHYYRGTDYDGLKLNILDRYKNYNGTEGNSPTAPFTESYSTAATTQPDIEDITYKGTTKYHRRYPRF